MTSKVKKIGILTSGGDAPGMNAAVRAVARSALASGIEVVGIRRGYAGLLAGDVFDMSLRSVSNIIQTGGTFLYSARLPEFAQDDVQNMGVEKCKEYGIDGLVVIGGDGSFRGAAALSRKGIPCIGIPGTIDNDISSTEYTIGFDTAINCVMEMVDRIRDTSQSHERCSVVEVMGRRAGYIALQSAIAVGATCVLVPEIPMPYEEILKKINETRATGKSHFIIITAEGVGGTQELTSKIEEDTGIESRYTILGHVQRGGSPTVRDRVMASKMGNYAVGLLKQGIGNRVVALQQGKITDFDIQEALAMKKEFPMDLYKMSYDISI